MFYLSEFVNIVQKTFYLFITKYFTFRGRSNRTEYICFNILIFGLDYFLSWCLRFFYDNNALIMSSLITIVILFFPSLTVDIRRFHDFNKSGWWLLGLYVLLLICSFLISRNEHLFLKSEEFLIWIIWGYTIVLGCIKGTPGPNKYGDPPEY